VKELDKPDIYVDSKSRTTRIEEKSNVPKAITKISSLFARKGWDAGLQYHVPPMDKQHYYFALIPPRPSFPQDMTSEERALMDKHSVYFRQHFNLGKLLLYGPVMAPDGAFGLGILEFADEAEARRFGENDPSVRGGLNRFEVYPMQVAAACAKS
jgi:uncharacterized protein YciI